MIQKLLLGLVALVAIAFLVVLGLASTKPDEFRIERSRVVTAAPATAFAIVNDFHRFAEWSPWQKLDPAMKSTITGEPGAGSSLEWSGNDKAGAGRMTINESTPDSHIGMKLEFLKPFESTSTTNFDFAPEGAGTKVTWTMLGKHNMMSKVMCVFMDMDKAVGKDFEEGLGNLDKLAANEPAPAAADSTAAAPATN